MKTRRYRTFFIAFALLGFWVRTLVSLDVQDPVLLDTVHGQTEQDESSLPSEQPALPAVGVTPGEEPSSDVQPSDFQSLIGRNFDHPVVFWSDVRDSEDSGDLFERDRYRLVVVSSPLVSFRPEEEQALASYLRSGGALFLTAGSCPASSIDPGEIEILNDLLEGLSDAGLESGFRFESRVKPASTGIVLASIPDDPIIRGRFGDVMQVSLEDGYILSIDSSLNPSVRAFSIETAAGEKWPFLAAAVVGGGRIAAFGSGSSIAGCHDASEEVGAIDQQSSLLLNNLLAWLMDEWEVEGGNSTGNPPIIITEVRWAGDRNGEYIELQNISGDEIDLEGWTLTDGEDVYILRRRIAAGGYYLLEYDEDATPVMADEVYGDDAPKLELQDDGDRISLLDRWGDVFAVVNPAEARWPAGISAGTAVSMELIDEHEGYAPGNWRSSVGGGLVSFGTPRSINSTKLITPFIPDFRAAVKGGAILLEWGLGAGGSVSHYFLYRSVDARLNPLEGTGTFTRLNTFPIPADSVRYLDTAIDSSLTYNYMLGVVFEGGVEKFSEPVTISLRDVAGPTRYSVAMGQNFPNPFNPNTEIRFEIEDLLATGEPIDISVIIFSPRGRIVRRLFERRAYPGTFSARWDGRDDNGEEVGSGAYYYQLLVRDPETEMILVRVSRKMVLMR